MLSQFLQMAFFGGLLLSGLGRAILPTGKLSKFLEDNQMAILGVCFMCNIFASNLLNTGAFEVYYNGERLWSKIETGRFPDIQELRGSLETAMSVASSSL